MARPGKLIKLSGDSAVKNSTLINNSMLANMPINVEGFINGSLPVNVRE
jgi:hypothetical protein